MSAAASDERLAALLARRSVSPRRLQAPGPSADEVALALSAGLRAPDHGGLVPWRIVLLPTALRPALARLFVEEKQRRDPLASADDLARARTHATDAPTLLAFVVRPRHDVPVPVHEQWLGAGAALMNLLNAFDALGYGAILLSGERCADRVLAERLGVRGAEVLAGFLSVGRIDRALPAVSPKPQPEVLSIWRDTPDGASAEPLVGSSPATS